MFSAPLCLLYFDFFPISHILRVLHLDGSFGAAHMRLNIYYIVSCAARCRHFIPYKLYSRVFERNGMVYVL